MTPRLVNFTKWIWCMLIVQPGFMWAGGAAGTVKPPIPSTIEAQAKFFQDFFSVQLSPHKLEFGHVCEDPEKWEQRYESKDYKTHRDMGKVRWGDKNGGYGEHYWDLNHHGGIDDNDDGSFDEKNPSGDGSNDSNEINDSNNNPDKQNLNDAKTDSKVSTDKPLDVFDDQNKIGTKTHPRFDQMINEKIKQSQQQNNQLLTDVEIKQSDPTKFSQPVVVLDYIDDDKTKDMTTIKMDDRRWEMKPYSNIEGVARPTITNRQWRTMQSDSKRLGSDESVKKAHRDQYNAANNQPYNTYISAGFNNHRSTILSRWFLDSSATHIVDRVTGQAFLLQPFIASAD